jgi:hypothetical protein
VAESDNKPWFIRWPVTAWCDALAAIEQMPWVFGTALLGVVVLRGVDAFVIPQGTATGFDALIRPLVVGIVQMLLVTPAAIAVHRFVILQERTSHYRLDLGDRRTTRFFFCAVAIQALISVPVLLFPVLLIALARLSTDLTFISSMMLPILFVVAWALVTLRTLILFPAIAVEAPGVGWNNALVDTKGHVWRMLALVLITATPAFAVGLLRLVLLGRALPSGEVGRAILIVLSGVETTVVMAVFAALASRIFLVLANRLASQSAEPGQA